jgi:hypothetical protein
MERQIIDDSPKKSSQKKNPWNFFQIFVDYPGFTANLGYACENFGSLGPLVWEEIENAQTVHKGLAKLLYRYAEHVKDILFKVSI